MAAKYFAILTNLGAAKLANATALGTQLEITHMAVGDGGGGLPIPNPVQTALIGERRRAAINLLTIDPLNNSQIISEQVIPEDVGGWWIREVGLFDKDGTLVAIANCPETYKPQLQEGSGRTQTIRVILIVSSTQSVSLKIDPSVVLATRKYVDDNVIEVRSYVDKVMADHVAAENAHKQYAKIAKAPDTLNDLEKIARSINNDPDFVGTIASLINAKKVPTGVPLPWPTSTPPAGWIKCNGAAFNIHQYPKLALAYPSGVLPDLRGVFIRGWDDGRGIDAGRQILSMQSDQNKAHVHFDLFSYGGGAAGGTPGTASAFAKRYVMGSEGFNAKPEGDGGWPGDAAGLGTSRSGGNEARPINASFNMIVEAA